MVDDRRLDGCGAAVRILTPADPEPADGTSVCALVNSMPDAALAQTEAQFLGLLAGATVAPGGIAVRRYSLPGVPRSAATAQLVDQTYFPIEHLWRSETRTVVFTGAEPVAADLREEPYWAELTRTFDWGRQVCARIAYSCLAAHAAVLHFDAVDRTRLPAKCSGVFAHEVTDDPLTAGVADQIALPHSRWNGLDPARLHDAGYRILARSGVPHVGWGVAARHDGDRSEILFQGHPEYSADTLLREFRRDVARWHAADSRSRPAYPTLPDGYFDDEDLRLLDGFARPPDRPDADAIHRFPYHELAARRRAPWARAAATIWANWLAG